MDGSGLAVRGGGGAIGAMKQSFAWWCFANRGVEACELLAGAARLGYAGVELIDEALWPAARKAGLQI